MSLIDSMSEECVLLKRTLTADSEGGYTNNGWSDSSHFRAAIIRNGSYAGSSGRIAEKETEIPGYIVTVRREVGLAFHDVFRRVKDSQIFRVSSFPGDKKSPAISSLNMDQFTAERWELTE